MHTDMHSPDGLGGTGVRKAGVPAKPLVFAAAVALTAVVTVAVTVTRTPDDGGRAEAKADPAGLYGRWVHAGDACDTKRGDMVITAGGITNREGGSIRSEMKLGAVKSKAPDTFEVKYESFNTSYAAFADFQLKDATTLMVSRYLFYPDAIWRKCPS